ncbi:hypothetical protein HPB52_017911 [Rhipicephalus sanguineus]|uniref:Uncharacterized protein n=1 Tax=Rhipicephalus sanguineus TaxID=34632 RepID=A0A9D4T811_RHISA|nr:hypothetical protein HPB52_017911 [Rhipicephalus sanguineus]
MPLLLLYHVFADVIYARRRELLNMKVSQWKPFLQRLDHSLRSNLDVNATCLRDMRSFVDAVMQRSAAVLNCLTLWDPYPVESCEDRWWTKDRTKAASRRTSRIKMDASSRESSATSSCTSER